MVQETTSKAYQRLTRMQLRLAPDGQLLESRVEEFSAEGQSSIARKLYDVDVADESRFRWLEYPRWVWQVDVDVPDYRKWDAAMGGISSSEVSGAGLAAALTNLERRLLPLAE